MKSVLGSGGRMNVLVSSSAAAGREIVPELAEVEVGLGDRQPPDQVLRELVGLQAREDRADLVHQRYAHGVLGRHQLDQPTTALVARGERFGEQVAEQVDLDAALAHLLDELVVLELGALHPEHVVEEQIVVVRRRQPLEAQLGPMDHHLAQLPDLGVHTERFHQAPFMRGTTCVPAVPSTIAPMSPSEPIAARFPVFRTNWTAASTLGPIEPLANDARPARPGSPGRARCCGVPQSA